MDFNKVKELYDRGLWKIFLVRKAVTKGIITADQFKEITGQDF